jgi:hypothetical protein
MEWREGGNCGKTHLGKFTSIERKFEETIFIFLNEKFERFFFLSWHQLDFLPFFGFVSIFFKKKKKGGKTPEDVWHRSEWRLAILSFFFFHSYLFFHPKCVFERNWIRKSSSVFSSSFGFQTVCAIFFLSVFKKTKK